MNILIIDNYDSFVYNLVQYVGEYHARPHIRRNNAVDIKKIRKLQPKGIIISPGPGTPANPEDMGKNLTIIKEFYTKIPMLGVCLGLQAILYAFGGRIIKAKHIMHGKTSEIDHNQKHLFRNIVNPLTVMRYHSLVADTATFPHNDFDITARTLTDNEIFAVKHKKYPVFGVQFHPESVGTYDGKKIIQNFLRLCNDSY